MQFSAFLYSFHSYDDTFVRLEINVANSEIIKLKDGKSENERVKSEQSSGCISVVSALK